MEISLMTDHTQTRLGIEDIIGDKREDILRLAAQYGASNVRVFGSVARGEARPDSDVDFIMKFRDDTNIFDMVGLWQDLTDLMGREVD
jgi:predicted nucleotidyltransferase